MTSPTSLTLTQRDLALLQMVHAYSGLTVDHVRQRFFPTPGARSACYARIQKLVAASYLISLRLGSLTGIGSGKAFLTLGPQGRVVLAELLEIPRTELGRASRMKVPAVVHHHLAICDIRLSVELAAERSQLFSLVEWIPDSELQQSPLRVVDPLTRQVVAFVPDGAFRLALPDGTEQGFLLEVDLGTIPPKRMRAKLRAYLAARTEPPVPILFVVPDTGRQHAINGWALAEATQLRSEPTLFWLATKDELCAQSVLAEPIWQVVGGPAHLALAALASEVVQPTVLPNGDYLLFDGGCHQ